MAAAAPGPTSMAAIEGSLRGEGTSLSREDQRGEIAPTAAPPKKWTQAWRRTRRESLDTRRCLWSTDRITAMEGSMRSGCLLTATQAAAAGSCRTRKRDGRRTAATATAQHRMHLHSSNSSSSRPSSAMAPSHLLQRQTLFKPTRYPGGQLRLTPAAVHDSSSSSNNSNISISISNSIQADLRSNSSARTTTANSSASRHILFCPPLYFSLAAPGRQFPAAGCVTTCPQ